MAEPDTGVCCRHSSEVDDLHRRQIGRHLDGQLEDLRVEEVLAVERAPDRERLPEAVALALEAATRTGGGAR
jgi:hypothetical protein